MYRIISLNNTEYLKLLSAMSFNTAASMLRFLEDFGLTEEEIDSIQAIKVN